MSNEERTTSDPTDVTHTAVEDRPQRNRSFSDADSSVAPGIEGDGPQTALVTPLAVPDAEVRFRRWATRIAVLGTWLLAAFFSIFLGHQAIWGPPVGSGSWVLQLMQGHFAATIGVPLSAISSACIVLILESTSGPIRFEALGFKFRGASGPVILWLLCFLAMTSALKILWNP